MTEQTSRQGKCATLERKESKLARPRKWKVILLNDDYTTMDFVVSVLVCIFGKSPAEAEQLMLTVHRSGRAVAGVYVRDVAESLADQVVRKARSAGFPLRCTLEPEEQP